MKSQAEQAATPKRSKQRGNQPCVRLTSKEQQHFANMKSYLSIMFPTLAHFRAEFYELSYQNFVDLDKDQQERYLFLVSLVNDLIKGYC